MLPYWSASVDSHNLIFHFGSTRKCEALRNNIKDAVRNRDDVTLLLNSAVSGVPARNRCEAVMAIPVKLKELYFSVVLNHDLFSVYSLHAVSHVFFART